MPYGRYRNNYIHGVNITHPRYANVPYFSMPKMSAARIRKPRRRTRRGLSYKSRLSLQQELKFKDFIRDFGPVPVTGTVMDSISLVAQGTLENERIGRKIILRSVGIRFEVILPASSGLSAITATGGDVLRIIIYVDKQANGANASVSDLLESNELNSFYNLANKNRFQILANKFVTINLPVAVNDTTTSSISTPEVIRRFQWYKSKCTIPIEFISTGAIIANVTSNNLGIIYISKNGFCHVDDSNIRIRFDG